MNQAYSRNFNKLLYFRKLLTLDSDMPLKGFLRRSYLIKLSPQLIYNQTHNHICRELFLPFFSVFIRIYCVPTASYPFSSEAGFYFVLNPGLTLYRIMICENQFLKSPSLINAMVDFLDIFSSCQLRQLLSIYFVILFTSFAYPFVNLRVGNN